jgi:hypothetical protein
MSRRFVVCVCVPIALLTLPAAPANALPASFQGSIAGFVFSGATKMVRPLPGIPGATRLDPPIVGPVDSASTAPGGKWAFINRSGHAAFVSGLSGMASKESSIGRLDGLIDAGDRYLWLAYAATQSVFVYETSSRSLPNTLPLNFAPSRFEAISAAPVLLLTGDRGKEWLLVLDASQVPVSYFVPGDVEERL